MSKKITKTTLFLLIIGLMMGFQNLKAQTAEPQVKLELPPKDNNPRNSEGDFITLKSGRILFVYSHYVGKSSSDHAAAHLASRYSDDGGKTWSQEDQVFLQNEGKMNVMSVSLLRLKNGKIALFYLKKNAIDDCIPMMRLSKDEGKTWSDPKPCITDQAGYFVLNNNRVIQLKNGRLMLAVARHQTPTTKWTGIGKLFAYFSDNNGKTWKSGGDIANPDSVTTQEPGLIELKDGRIMMFIRADKNVQYQAFSSDKGKTWTAIERSSIASPLSPASICRLPKTGDLLLVWNNNDGSNPDIKGKRTPLSIAISKDEGKTWQHLKNLETDTDGWYCYTAIHCVGTEAILLGYCAGSRSKRTGLSKTDVRLVPVDWLYKTEN